MRTTYDRVVALSFVIVGTPRSGTTLVQRLAAELPGVRIPPETHFFALHAPDLMRRRRFPLDQRTLAEELRLYSARPETAGLELDHDAVIELLGGRCAGPVDLFEAIVLALTGPAASHGEKTPSHLNWWDMLTRARPDLVVVGVVRDPRAVAASNLAVPFGMAHPELLAERWVADQRELRRAARHLGPRLVSLRYEDVVADPEAARARLAAAAAVRSGADASRAVDPIHLDFEEDWKGRAAGPVTTTRREAWRSELDESVATLVSSLCGAEMAKWGYAATDRRSRLTAGLSLGPRAQIRRQAFRATRLARQRAVDRWAHRLAEPTAGAR